MNISRLSAACALTGAVLFAAAPQAMAQSVVTDPVGFTTLTVNAKPPTKQGFTYLSLNMFRPTAYRSVVPTGAGLGASTVGGFTVLTFPANTFTTNQFAGAANAHFVELTNGTSAGVLANVTSNDTTSITLAENITSLITNGTTTIKLRPHWTFATAFGATNSAGFFAASSSAAADTVALLIPATGARTTFFFNPTAVAGFPNGRWQTGFSNANDITIPPDAGLIVERKSATAFSFTLVGEVKLGPIEAVVVGGGTVSGGTQNVTAIPNPYPLASIALKDSTLYTGNAATGVFAASSSAAADTLGVFDTVSGTFTSYFYNPTAVAGFPNGRWQTGFSDASNFVIPEGAAVIITRKASRPSFSWFIPQPAMNL